VTKNEKVEWCSGIRVITRESSIVFDPTSGGIEKEGTHRFISHAHADHTQGFSAHGAKYATASTRIIYEGIHKRPVTDFKEVRANQPVRLDDVEVLPKNAGHMLGSVQFKITTPNNTLAYTGDLNCVDTLTTDRAEAMECDVLLIEATYGNPSYVFPDRESTYAKIVEWATQQVKNGSIPTFHVYAAGKAQEIVRLFNVYTRLPIVVSSLVSAANKAYQREGVRLRYEEADKNSENHLLKNGPYVYVTTPFDRLASGRCARAMATGWALRSVHNRFPVFPLSSHADFRQLVEFVKATGAKRVYVFTGFSDLFSSYLEKRFGIDARPIPLAAQRELVEFNH